MVKVYNSFTDTIIDSDVMLAAERLIAMSKKKGMWDMIGEIISAFEHTKPKQWTSHLVSLNKIKDSRANKHASTKDKTLRYLLDIPEPIMRMIRILYPVDVLPMDKKFFRTLAQKYPMFKVAQKV